MRKLFACALVLGLAVVATEARAQQGTSEIRGRVAYQSISPAGAEGAFYYVKADYRF